MYPLFFFLTRVGTLIRLPVFSAVVFFVVENEQFFQRDSFMIANFALLLSLVMINYLRSVGCSLPGFHHGE